MESNDSNDNNDQNQSHSRFQVAKVNDNDNDNDNDTNDQLSDIISPLTQKQVSIDYSNTYDSKNLKSFRYYTREALPRVDNYRNILSLHGHMRRPTLDELHGTHGVHNSIHREFRNKKYQIISREQPLKDGSVKLGWIEGVLIRCMLNIWGVILFLRLSWVVGQSGILNTFLIILLSTAVTVITTLSMCAICTNGEVKGGGTYYMISRSLGPEFGGSIGIIFSLANAVAVSMYSVGFAEALQDVFDIYDIEIIDGGLNDLRIISSITIAILLCIALIGTQWESKAQIVLLVILIAAMIDFLIGSVIPPTEEKMSKGYIGWNFTLLTKNLMPNYRHGETFFSVFAIFFPAATGMLAGANISGDLKDPQRSIPIGSLLAIAITSSSYFIFAFIFGSVMTRDANGSLRVFNVSTSDTVVSLITNCSTKCEYGLHNNFQVMELISAFGPLIYAGMFAATLSSALASLVSAPKVFQAICKDKVFPYIEYFGKGFGKNNEPRRSYVLAFGIALCCCIIGELNLIAPIITNFFLGAYCLINFSCFHASFAKSPGFRPSFKYYNKWISLLGSLLSLSVMFSGHWSAALITFVLVLAIYLYILRRKPNVNWGSSTQAQTYLSALRSVYKLNFVADHVKNYRPQILVLCANPYQRPPLVDFAYCIVKKIGLLICGHIESLPLNQKLRENLAKDANAWLTKRNIKGFYNLIEESSFSKGVNSLIQLSGMGKLKPNMILMGFKDNWLTCNEHELVDYFEAIHNIFDKYFALGILRLPNGLDYARYGKITEIIESFTENRRTSALSDNKSGVASNISSDINIDNESEKSFSSSSSVPSTPHMPYLSENNIQLSQKSFNVPRNMLESVNQFKRKQKKGSIDVWWLYDDGGLTLLIPYLLTTRKQWRDCKLRIFALANSKRELDTEERNMAALLSKFRIDYSDVTMIPDLVKPPQPSNLQAFNDLIAKWRVEDCDEESDGESKIVINESEILALRDKTNRHIRLRELLCQYSNDATLIVMTLPMPRKGTCSAPMYMAWLETLTHNMPPFLLIRGNQTDVLTFYS